MTIRHDLQDPAYTSTVSAQLLVEVSNGSAARVLRAARRWMRLGLTLTGHELGDRLATAAASGEYLGMDRDLVVPDGITAHCAVDRPDEEWSETFSTQSWNRLLDSFTAVPDLAAFEVDTWADDHGFLVPGRPALHVHCVRDTDPDWLLLYLDGSTGLVVGTPDKDESMVEFIRTVAEDCDPAFGTVSYERVPYLTVLDRALADPPSVGRSREIVRSYGWVTVISEETGTRLGGADALAASGAFHQVERLAAGGFFLRATPAFHEYREQAAHRVFHALAPVLPHGMPDPPSVPGEPDVVIREDPARAGECRWLSSLDEI